MSLSYAGVPLQVADEDLCSWLEANIPWTDIFEEFDLSPPPSGTPTSVSVSSSEEVRRPLRLGSLWWPRGASRWAQAHFLVTSDVLNAIRTQVYTYGTGGVLYSPQPLVMSSTLPTDPTRTITASMYMLPPRPLSQLIASVALPLAFPPVTGLYLLTLVDQRYFWWYRQAADIEIADGSTQWTDVYNSLAGALGITINVDPISPNYLSPSGNLSSMNGFLPPLLDKVALDTGMRIVVNLAGQVFARTASNAILDLFSDLAQIDFTGLTPTGWHLQAGGQFLDYPQETNDLNAAVPTAVELVFPQTQNGNNAIDSKTYNVTVTLGSLNLPDFAGATGYNGTKVFLSTVIADFSGGGGTPGNLGQLQALAQQVATDYYRFALPRVDLKLIGAVPWVPEATSDGVEWLYRLAEGPQPEISCRVFPVPFNDLTHDIVSTGSAGSTQLVEVSNETFILDNVNYLLISPVFYYSVGGPVTINLGPNITIVFSANQFLPSCSIGISTNALGGIMPYWKGLQISGCIPQPGFQGGTCGSQDCCTNGFTTIAGGIDALEFNEADFAICPIGGRCFGAPEQETGIFVATRGFTGNLSFLVLDQNCVTHQLTFQDGLLRCIDGFNYGCTPCVGPPSNTPPSPGFQGQPIDRWWQSSPASPGFGIPPNWNMPNKIP